MHKSALIHLAVTVSVAASITIHVDSIVFRSRFPPGHDYGACTSDCQPFLTVLNNVCPGTDSIGALSSCVCTPADASHLQSCLNCGVGAHDPVLVPAGELIASAYNNICIGESSVPTVTFSTTESGPTSIASSPATTPSSSPPITMGRVPSNATSDAVVSTVAQVTPSGPPPPAITAAGTNLSAAGTLAETSAATKLSTRSKTQMLGILFPILFLGAV